MKKFLPVMLSLTMLATLFTGCGSEEVVESVVNVEVESGEPAVAEDVVAPPADLDPVTLKMYFHGSKVTDDTAVMKEVNKYLTEKLNVTLEPIWGTWSDFDNNVKLSLQGGDDVDIYFTCAWSANDYSIFSADGYYVRLDDPENNLIEKHATELWSQLPEVLTKGAVINGASGKGVYAVPAYKDIATQNCWDINVPLLEKYGYTVADIENTDFYGFGEILETVKVGEGDDFFPLMIEGAVAERMATNSIIVTGDATPNMLSYYINPEDTAAEGPYGNKIFSKFETPEYEKYATQIHEYYKAGYVDPAMGNADQANATRTENQKSGSYLISTQSYSLGYEVQASAERGFEVAMVPVTPPYVDTTSSQGAMMAVSTSSENPDRAVMLLNLLNTDPYLMTLLNFGIEGTHYNMNEAGEVEFIPEIRDTYMPWTNGMGNITLLPPQAGQGADFQNTFKEYYGAAGSIPVLGFAFNKDNVSTQLGALANTANEFSTALNAGTIDPAEKLPEFIKALKDNGMDEVIAEANAQLDAFLAGKE